MALKEYISEQDFFDYWEAFPEQENLYEKKNLARHGAMETLMIWASHILENIFGFVSPIHMEV